MHLIEYVGMFAGAISTISLIPQVWLVWKKRSAEGISLGMYSSLSLGLFCWIIYGLWHKIPVMVVANTLTLLLCLCVIVMYFLFAKKPRCP